MSLSPIIYLPHGGGPMPLMADPAHAELIAFLQRLGQQLELPRAILIVSAHWEHPEPAILADQAPGLLYDYYGFPPETYQISYPVPGSPELAGEIGNILKNKGFSSSLITGRGLDHGVFVPLKLLFPNANVPCVQLSLIAGLDAEKHIQMGLALAELSQQGVLILGSGMSFHNLRAIFAPSTPEILAQSDAFDTWLGALMTENGRSARHRLDSLIAWKAAPGARFCHPREEHLLPLMVCTGAAGGEVSQRMFNRPIFGHKVSGFGWNL